MSRYGQHFSTLTTPQTERARGDQVKNSASGYVFQVDCWKRLDRFLVLGSEGGAYYVGERELTKDNAKAVEECLHVDGARAVARIVEVSDTGRAPKNDAAIFALAMAAGAQNAETRRLALAALPKVCRIGTHLFSFVDDVKGFRGWGRGLQSAIARWYNEKTADQVAYQAIKYAQRGGQSHRDVLRRVHLTPVSPAHNAAYRWIVGNKDATALDAERKNDRRSKVYPTIDREKLPKLLLAFEDLQRATDKKDVLRLVRDFRMPHECVDGKWKAFPEVWETMLPDMGITALIRNLGKMTSVGLFKPMGAAVKLAASRIGDKEVLKKGRVHPLAILLALKTYERGHGDKGSLTWTPAREIVDALNEAFYLAFDAVEPSGKNHLLALDVSGSMNALIAGSTLSCAVASAAMAMVTMKTEPSFHLTAFTSGVSRDMWGRGTALKALDISKASRLDDVLRTISNLPFGGTDCALPMLYALKEKIEVDTFVVYTDNETWSGDVHPFQALRDYRQKMGRAAKLVVVGITSTGFSIADPTDAGMLDVVGLDASAPAVMADFSRD